MAKQNNKQSCRKKRIFNLVSSKVAPFVSLIILILILASCATMDENKATLVLDVSSPFQTNTLLPDIDMTPAGYDFAGTGPDGATFSFIDAQPPVLADGLAPGGWTITVNAKNATGTVIGMGEQTTTLNPGQSQTINITVTPVEGYGLVDITLYWSAVDTYDPSITAQLVPASGSPIDLAFVIETEGTATYTGSDIPTGYHTLVVQLLDNGILTMGAVEVVRVVKEQTTSGTYEFYEINQLGSIVVNITPEMNDPIEITMSGQVAEVEIGGFMTVEASVPAETGNVVYVWYINGESKATGSSYTTPSDLLIGVYRLDVVVFTTDGSRAGSATHTFRVIDTEPSVSSITSSTSDGTYGAGNNIDVTITFSEAVTLDAAASLDVMLDTGAVVSVTGPAGPSTTFSGTYTVETGDSSVDLDSTAINLSAGTIVDGTSNAAVIELPATTIATGSAIVIDTTKPSLSSITSSTADGNYGAGNNIDVTITFSEAVTLDAAASLDVTLDTGAVVSITGPAGPSTTFSGTYTVGAGDNSADLDSTAINLSAGTIVDGSSNAAVIGLPATTIATGSAIVIDTTEPSVSSITSSTADGTYGAGNNIDVTITFSEAVTLDAAASLDVMLDTGAVVSVTGPAGPSTTFSGTYTVETGDSSVDLDSTAINLSAGTIVDGTSNAAVIELPATTIATGSAIVIL